MNANWECDFEKHFARVIEASPRPEHALAISCKVRALGSCFHKQHAPAAYEVIEASVENESFGVAASSAKPIPQAKRIED